MAEFGIKKNAIAILWMNKEGTLYGKQTIISDHFPRNLYSLLMSLFRTLQKQGLPYCCDTERHVETESDGTQYGVIDSITFKKE